MQRSRNSGSSNSRSQKRDTKPRKHSNSGSEASQSDSERNQKHRTRGARHDSASASKSVSRSRSRSRSESEERPSRGAQRAPVERKSGDDCSELFVRNLPWKADEESISDYFSKYGKVQNVKILYNRDTGKAKGIGFVDFATREEAQNVIDNAAELEMDGRKVEVSFSNKKEDRPDNRGGRDSGRDSGRDRRRDNAPSAESNTIFVGNLDFKTSEGTIRDFFDDCGSISDVRIAKTPEGKNKGFCHVEFESTEAAAKAMKRAGDNIDGREIRVDFSSQRQGGGSRDRGFSGGSRGGFRGGNRDSRGGRGGSRGGSRGGFNRNRY